MMSPANKGTEAGGLYYPQQHAQPRNTRNAHRDRTDTCPVRDGPGGVELAVRFRIGLEGDRFRWKSGTKPCLYGLHRLAAAQAAGQVVLVEGESDCHTLWSHGIPALGIPGAANWREDRDARHLDGIETIYIVVEPDRGGDTIQDGLSRSSIRHRATLICLPTKDASALHLEGQKEFARRWQDAYRGATPWTAVEAKASAAQRTEAWEKCAALAQKGNILDEFTRELLDIGVVGEERAAKIIFLAMISRLLDRPVSVAVKGPSSGGKSFLVESTLKFFPAQAFYALTAMSEHALAYSNEPLRHRHLVIYEAAGMHSEFATYLIRSLLSEGCLRYETVEKTDHGLEARLIEREGPTGLIVTTTSLRLHPENETRMLSIMITDSREQTREVFRAVAEEAGRDDRDLSRWHALQVWLATGSVQVVISFAKRFAERVQPVAIRLWRDFKKVLTMIRSHDILHQASRLKDERGQVVATTEDYAAVRSLVEDVVSGRRLDCKTGSSGGCAGDRPPPHRGQHRGEPDAAQEGSASRQGSDFTSSGRRSRCWLPKKSGGPQRAPRRTRGGR